MTRSIYNSSPMISIATTDDEIYACFDPLRQLRPNLEQSSFLHTIRSMMAEGYRLAYDSDDDTVVCVAGFRVAHNLFMGKHLYVEDLVTPECVRSNGKGSAMMGWLADFARTEKCNVIHLDSGVQRHAAHKFYLNQGLKIVCYHFAKDVE